MPDKIIISRTDSIGDVILTLPMAGALKAHMPDSEVIFMGRNYTRDIVALSKHVDRFVSWDEQASLKEDEQVEWMKEIGADALIHVFPRADIARLAAKAKIPIRVGSTGRLYNYLYCNKLVPLSRKNSKLHEAQLNFKLLSPFIDDLVLPERESMPAYYGFEVPEERTQSIRELVDTNRFNLILHPKSKGSAREWPLEQYTELIRLLPSERYHIFITATIDERALLREFLKENEHKVTDLTGKFSLKEFIGFINLADGLVAASTGPLHIAAALGKLAIGIYPPIRPMHPGRWAPIGKKATFLVAEKTCNDCRKSLNCHCMGEIKAVQVQKILEAYDEE